MTVRGRWRLGVDIGGTFTDFVLSDEKSGRTRLHKRLTTAADPSLAAVEGIDAVCADEGIAVSEVAEVVHGTTLVTNAIIERKGAKVGFLTTRGFRDLIEMGTEQRYDIYDLFLKFPPPLVPRALRLEVAERIDARGRVVTALDEAGVDAAVKNLLEAGVGAIAVGYLNAYRNPAHELRTAEIIARLAPGIPVSLSTGVVAEIREYPRFVTACANAYVQPMMADYLARLSQRLAGAGFGGALWLMHSAGGLASLETARAFPIRFLESGPAGGGLAALHVGRLANVRDVFAFDMGGTTAKGCLIEGGVAPIAPMLEAGRVHRFTKGSGLPITSPVLDMIEIGGGGGSIAAIDEIGLLRVGPHSAGSAPGPACYGLGAEEPTVTDANLLLGYYDPAFFLGGKMRLEPDLASAAVARLAERLGLSTERVAHGIHTLVNENMASAFREHTIERGYDPRRLTMIAFGGAGPAHATGVARILGVSEVIVPPASGAASALGFLAAPLSFEVTRSLPMRVDESWRPDDVERVLGELTASARAELIAADVPANLISLARKATMRLAGQLHEIAVALPPDLTDPAAAGELAEAFRTEYRRHYAFLPIVHTLEIMTFRVEASGPMPALSVGSAGIAAGSARKGTRQVWDGSGYFEAAVYDRYTLGGEEAVVGPAMIEEREATTVLLAGDRARIDGHGNIRITIAAGTRIARPPAGGFDAEVAALRADPIGLEIMWARLAAVSEEMWSTVCRTAYSLIVSEAQDFACELLDGNGETLAHSRRGMPVFNLTLPRAVKALLEEFPPATLKPGDVLITNDPWLCAGHLPDVAVVTPVFRNGRLVGLAGTVGHVSDIGGTKDSLHARELYDEGLQIPPMKLLEAGTPNATLVRLIKENVRGSEQVIGDLFSFVGANEVGAKRLLALMDEYGLDDLAALAHVVQSLSETAMRAAVNALPDGVYEAESWANPLGVPYRLPVRLTVAGSEIEIDFAGAPPTMLRGGLNCTFSYTEAHATYPLKCLLTPQVRGTAGCYRPFRVKAPEGSVLNAQKPASVNVRTRTGWYIGPSIYRALSGVLPDRVRAFSGLPISLTVYGKAPEGDYFSDVFLAGGGQGGASASDGISGLIFPSSAANTSIEVFEARVPVVLHEKSFVPDSGGPGQFRGGLAQRIVLGKRDDDGAPLFISIFPEGVGLDFTGLHGGEPGTRAHGQVRTDGGTIVRDCGTGELVTLETAGHLLEAVLTGGSGYGPPALRSDGALLADLEGGYVTVSSARAQYRARNKQLADEA